MRPATIAALLLVFALPTARPASAQRFTQTNLVSDISGEALRTDANLSNPWGLVPGASGVFWTSNNGSGTSSLFDPDGTIRPLVVTIPGGGPTGIVATAASDSSFGIPTDSTDARAVFIFVTLGGTVVAWNPANTTTAVQVASNAGAVYTGAALGGTQSEPRLYAADFAGGKIDVYDRDFALVTPSGTFTDPSLPEEYYPFNIANVGGQLYVAYAQQDTVEHEEEPGPGLGIVSVFDMDGNFIRRFATGDQLNAPWAIVQAPAGFDSFGGDILIGNFGNGWINAYDASTGAFQGSLQDTLGSPIAIEGLWGLAFGSPASGTEVSNRLYFAAGIDDEAHGLFGFLAVAADSDTTQPPPVACDRNEPQGFAFWRDECGGDRQGHGHGHGWGHFPGHHPHGLPPGHDRDGDGRDDHGFGGEPSDSLDDAFDDISSAAPPNAFGDQGCFTASCELLNERDPSGREEAAQALLLTRLNLNAGNFCDSLAVTCGADSDGVEVLTLGAIADSLDVLLCNDGDASRIEELSNLLLCANGVDGDDDDGDDQGEDHDRRGNFMTKIGIKTPGMNPGRLGSAIRFAISASQPAFVQLRIYDARGRLVAEPMHQSMVVGSANVVWDGRDQAGRLVTPGTYFYRAVSGPDVANGRFVLVH
jgi:uncharacterized protein (TIGR03118 family)